jgi:hypothetical protein
MKEETSGANEIKLTEIKQSVFPEIPPEIPFDPPAAPPNMPAVSVPMIYVDAPEKFEYRVAECAAEAEELEAELNARGREGWRLAQIIPRGKTALLVFFHRIGG